MLQHMACWLMCVAVAMSVVGTEGAVQKDLITSLPGITFKPSFKTYSGYLKATGTRKLHYWFTESSSSPATAPLVLWLNGGPGCSSLDGLLNENGPFMVSKSGKKINPNPYSWNKVANMIYLEAPAGVGYSYADDHNYTSTDDQVALDNYEALKYFLASYPEYAQNEFYITGESYGGVYIPTLAARIMEDATFNFKGFAIGNGLTDYNMNSNSLLYFMYYHGLIGSTLWNNMMATCCKGCKDVDRCDFVGNYHHKCKRLVKSAQASMNGINMYNMYAECYPPHTTNASKLQSLFDPRISLLTKPTLHVQQIKTVGAVDKGGEIPCVDSTGITTYLNRLDVRKALHIPSALRAWSICSNQVAALYVRQYQTVKAVFKKLISAQKYRILMYNGDIDMACNFLGDQWFADDLGLKLLKPSKAWMYKSEDGSKQVAGFRKVYDQHFVFTTIRGSGHMVPQDKPLVALDMFIKFLGKQEF